ncbi:hypothetical protein HKX48_004305 [Thoreauomyces humboldtii]|nr:hypothetical protein HKX48_004305 [Thoreauomyces humboldtii]
MTGQQVPLKTPFTAASTAADVLANVDLTGRQVIVTGGHGRLGSEVTRALVSAGATVTVAARSPEKASQALAGIPGVIFKQLDLTDPVSIEAFAREWNTAGLPLHVLVNNAAVFPGPQIERDANGHEASLSTSHLGHFRLTLALLPALRKAGEGESAARVVNVTSGAARFGGIRWEDPDFRTAGYNVLAAYAQSKRANVLFTVELDRRYRSEGIRVYATHPGVIIGPGPHSPAKLASYRHQGLVDDDDNTIIDPVAGKKTVEQGAATVVFAATSPLLLGVGGVYLKDSNVAVIDDELKPLTAESVPSDASSAMLDPVDARRLWELSEKLIAA